MNENTKFFKEDNMYRINLNNSGQILKISQKCRYKLLQLKKKKILRFPKSVNMIYILI